jgi:exodeoxyribonuclease VIII
MLQSPLHYKLARTFASVPSAAMQFGTAVHCGVLEPQRFDAAVACAPTVDKRTKDGRAEWAAFVAGNAHKVVLDADAYERAHNTISAVRAHPGAAELLDGALFEVSLFWNDARYGVPCKCRWDLFNHGGVVDLKTTSNASPAEFARQIVNFNYHVQAAHYLSGGEHARNEAPRFFAFIVVESEPPHAVACYALPGNAILAGAHLMNQALERYAAALAAGEWPGYPDTIEQIQLPRWATQFNV